MANRMQRRPLRGFTPKKECELQITGRVLWCNGTRCFASHLRCAAPERREEACCECHPWSPHQLQDQGGGSARHYRRPCSAGVSRDACVHASLVVRLRNGRKFTKKTKAAEGKCGAKGDVTPELWDTLPMPSAVEACFQFFLRRGEKIRDSIAVGVTTKQPLNPCTSLVRTWYQ